MNTPQACSMPPLPNTAKLVPERDPETALTFVVCSNDLGNVRARCPGIREQLGAEDRLLVVLDIDDTPAVAAVASELRSIGMDVIIGGSARGLSPARNRAIGAVRTRYIVFLDDDVTITRSAVTAIRKAFVAGSDIVGVRLTPAPGIRLSRWYISPSQFHYLGIHRGDAPGKTWGACMGFDLGLVRKQGVQFRGDLGRQGRKLVSGDDTTFVREMRQYGARERFLDEPCVYHHIDAGRLELWRMLARAIWQGRSEVRRRNAGRGAWKEWQRNIHGWCRSPLRTCCLASLYQLMVLLGVAIEFLHLAGFGRKSQRAG